MTIFLGADHAGYAYKEKARAWLEKGGHQVKDLGNSVLDETDDYPVFAHQVGRRVAKQPNRSLGILFCNSGAGMCIAANKVPGVRAVSVGSIKEARHSREHNGANVLCLGQGFLSWPSARRIIGAWLETPISHEPRHLRRIAQLEEV